jgi:hypothetical protein
MRHASSALYAIRYTLYAIQMCPHTYSYMSVLIAPTMNKNWCTQVEQCVGSGVFAIVWQVCLPKYCHKDNAPPQKMGSSCVAL